MNARNVTGASVEKPDWVDILLAAALASWGTIVGAALVFGLLPMMFAAPADAALTLYWFLLGYCFFGFVLATVVCSVVGLPALALANWLKLSEWWQAAILGAAAGLLISFASPGLPGVAALWDGMTLRLLFVVAGALAGLAAWRERTKGSRLHER